MATVVLFIIYQINIHYQPLRSLLTKISMFHATAYGILGFFAIGYFSRVLTKYRLALIVAFVFSAMYGASDEWHQSFVEGREADVYDWLADMFGAALLLLVANKFRLFKGKKK